jgi:hypothetical protein
MRLDSAEDANAITVKVIAVTGRLRRRQEKMILTVNEDPATRHIHDSRCGFYRVEHIGCRLKQLDLARA